MQPAEPLPDIQLTGGTGDFANLNATYTNIGPGLWERTSGATGVVMWESGGGNNWFMMDTAYPGLTSVGASKAGAFTTLPPLTGWGAELGSGTPPTIVIL